jgi:hypothetical protein
MAVHQKNYDEQECECKATSDVEGCGVCSDLGKMHVINREEDVTILFF